MKLGAKIKEKLARTIGDYFTTNEIVNVFTNANISTDKSLFAKWKITLDAFGKISTEECFFHILNEFCHPLNFNNQETRLAFIETLKSIFSYEDIEVKISGRKVQFILNNNGYETVISEPTPEIKTSTDYIAEAINFFKDEYNKVRISGLTYEYSLGENQKSEQTNQNYDDYDARFRAIKRLKDAGFITEYKIEERVESEGYYIWDYAVCKIDETKITKREEPRATEAGVRELIQKIEITNMPKLEIKGFEEKVILQKPKNKKIQLRKFPKDLKWEEVSMRFLNGQEVIITARNETLQTTYEAMGFEDEKKKLPNKQWQFLRLLSLKNGEISWENNQNLPLKQINSIKKQKQLLTEALKAYFQIYEDKPFHDYKTEKAYKIKLNLTPEPELKDIDEQEIYDK